MNEWFRFDSGTVESGVFVGLEAREVVLFGRRLGFDGMPGSGFYPCEERVCASIQGVGPNDKLKDFGFMYGEGRPCHLGSMTHEIHIVLLVPPRTFEDVLQMTLAMSADSVIELDVDTVEPIENEWFKPLPTVVGETELEEDLYTTSQYRLAVVRFHMRLAGKPIEVEGLDN